MAKKKTKNYVRKDLKPGIHAVCLGDGKERAIRIVGREIYITSKAREIKALDADPEVLEFTPEPTDEEKENEKERQEKKKQEAEEEAQSDQENDPGEGTPPLD